MRNDKNDRAASGLDRDRIGLAGYDEQTLSRAPSIVSDSEGRLMFRFSDGRMLVVVDQSDAGSPNPASSPESRGQEVAAGPVSNIAGR